jgi:hypothetical protein
MILDNADAPTRAFAERDHAFQAFGPLALLPDIVLLKTGR